MVPIMVYINFLRVVGESRFSSSSFSDVISYLSYTEYYARDGYGIFI